MLSENLLFVINLVVQSLSITLVANQADGKPETTLLDTFAVTAGDILELKMFIGKNGGYITTASSGAGVLGTS